jgi:hypothetical protein
MKITTKQNQTFVLTYEDLKDAFAAYLLATTGAQLPANSRISITADDNRGRALTMTVVVEGDLTTQEVGRKANPPAPETPAPGGKA